MLIDLKPVKLWVAVSDDTIVSTNSFLNSRGLSSFSLFILYHKRKMPVEMLKCCGCQILKFIKFYDFIHFRKKIITWSVVHSQFLCQIFIITFQWLYSCLDYKFCITIWRNNVNYLVKERWIIINVLLFKSDHVLSS